MEKPNKKRENLRNNNFWLNRCFFFFYHKDFTFRQILKEAIA